MKLKNLFTNFSSLSQDQVYDFITNYRINREQDMQREAESFTKKKRVTKLEARILAMSEEEQARVRELLLLCPDMKKFI